MIIDLHMHSYYSPDGRYSIQRLLDLYSEGDIAGLTDHETIGGWREFEKEAINRGIKPVLGVEWFLKECHILSYFLNGVSEHFCEFMKDRRRTEESCMRFLHAKFAKIYPQLLPYEEVLKLRAHPENILGKPALSDALAKAANIDRIKAEDMVRKEKNKMQVGVMRPMPFYPEEIIDKIIEWNAFPVLAHPYRNFGGREGRQAIKAVEERVRDLYNKGIKGIDVYSWNSDEEELDHLLGLCDELRLVPVIGSDFHYRNSQNKGLDPKELETLDEQILKRVEKWIRN
jgi:3',5'-nucleoside bisphosphate phosphatase